MMRGLNLASPALVGSIGSLFAAARFFTDAACTIEATLDGDLIAGYRDPWSGLIFTASGAQRPTLRLLPKVGGGTMQVAEFDGVSNVLTHSIMTFSMGSIYAGFMRTGGQAGFMAYFNSLETFWFASDRPGTYKLFDNNGAILADYPDNQWQRQAVCRQSSGNREFRRNGVVISSTTATDVPHTGSVNLFQSLKGYMSAVVFDDGNSFSETLDTALANLGAFAETRANVVWCDGDSMTGGSGSTGQAGSYPQQLATLLGDTYRVLESGIAGQTMAQMTSDAAAEIDANWPPSALQKIVVLWGGTNDLFFGASAATVAARLSTYWAARRAAGDKVVAVTILPRSDSGTPAGFEADRLTVNAYIRSHSSEYDALADVAANATIGDSGDELNTTYYADLVHMKNAGYAIVAGIVKAAIDTL